SISTSTSLSLLFLLTPPPPGSTLFPYTTLFRSERPADAHRDRRAAGAGWHRNLHQSRGRRRRTLPHESRPTPRPQNSPRPNPQRDRKSTRLNSSHVSISYAVFCLKKKKRQTSNL